jgi:hypothetical protein
MTRKGISGTRSIINTIKMKITELKLKMSNKTVSYPQRGYAQYVNSFRVPTENGNKDIRWYYTLESFEIDNPENYCGLYGSYQEEKDAVERSNFSDVKNNALEMLEQANIATDSDEVLDVLLDAYEEIVKCSSIEEIISAINTAQTLINVHLKEELDEEYTIKIKY